MKAIAVIAALISLSLAPSVPAQQAGDLRLNLTLTGDLFISYYVMGPGQPFRLRALF